MHADNPSEQDDRAGAEGQAKCQGRTREVSQGKKWFALPGGGGGSWGSWGKGSQRRQLLSWVWKVNGAVWKRQAYGHGWAIWYQRKQIHWWRREESSPELGSQRGHFTKGLALWGLGCTGKREPVMVFRPRCEVRSAHHDHARPRHTVHERTEQGSLGCRATCGQSPWVLQYHSSRTLGPRLA